MLDIALIILSIFAYGFGKLNDLLPVTLSNIFIFTCFLYHAPRIITNRVFYYNNFLLFLLGFIIIGAIINTKYSHFTDKLQFIIYYIVYSLAIISTIQKHGPEKLLKAYTTACIYLSIIGLIQVVTYTVGVSALNDIIRLFSENKNTSTSGLLVRATSIASEPAVLGLYLLPALVLSISKLFGVREASQYISTRHSILILAASACTLSLIVYIYLLIIVLTVMIKQRKFFLSIALTLFLILLYGVAQNIESINSRITELSGTENIESSENLSVIALNSNLKVTIASLNEDFFFGTGIVSHAEKYESLVYGFYSSKLNGVGLNKDDAASMYLRVLSELGVIGFLIFYSACAFYFSRKKYSSNNFIQEAFLISFLLYGIRYGSINTPMFWFYLTCFLGCYAKKYGFKAYRF